MRLINLLKKYIVILKMNSRKTKIKSIHFNIDTIFGKYCFIGKGTYILSNVKIGDFSYFNTDSGNIYINSNVEIGKFCSISSGVIIGAGNHDYKSLTTHPILYNDYYINLINKNNKGLSKKGLFDNDKKTIIGNDVWIGLNANIKRGIKVGNGAVIGMGAIVTKDVPDYAIVVGVPAKIIGYRFKEEDINFLNKTKWWNSNYSFLAENIDCFYTLENFKKIYNDRIDKS